MLTKAQIIKKSLNQSIQNYNQSTEQRTQDTQEYIQ
jgi:hypothetical protein